MQSVGVAGTGEGGEIGRKRVDINMSHRRAHLSISHDTRCKRARNAHAHKQINTHTRTHAPSVSWRRLRSNVSSTLERAEVDTTTMARL